MSASSVALSRRKPASAFGRYGVESGNLVLALSLTGYDPTATLAVHCGNGFDAGFGPYRSTRLSR
jgi:hypothetical protein